VFDDARSLLKQAMLIGSGDGSSRVTAAYFSIRL